MIKPATKEAYRLLHDGALALADVEATGMMVDTPRLDRTIEKVGNRIDLQIEKLKRDEAWGIWRKHFGAKANIGSGPQLGVVLFDKMGYKAEVLSEKVKRPKVDETELGKIDLPFVKTWLDVQHLKKLQSTYLKGIRREVCDGIVRPSYNLHLVRTYRGSCNDPNFQNIPIRDKKIGKLIRQCFVPRHGRVLVEVDYSALEFKVAACFWKDKSMVAYASDPDLDIHRDMAAECYMLDEVPKNVRFFAKNQFVFPTLYGSYFVNTSRNLWNAIASGDLKTADGIGLREHLESNGIKRLGGKEGGRGTYLDHVKRVEGRFNDRFPAWAKRKVQWQKRYESRGWFRMMTGFVCSGQMSRNNLMNYPIQGPAFHLLLWSLIEMVKRLREEGMKSKVVGQIHDSMMGDVVEEELDDYLEIAVDIMTQKVREAWPWIVTPLSVEAEVGRENWFEKEEIVL